MGPLCTSRGRSTAGPLLPHGSSHPGGRPRCQRPLTTPARRPAQGFTSQCPETAADARMRTPSDMGVRSQHPHYADGEGEDKALSLPPQVMPLLCSDSTVSRVAAVAPLSSPSASVSLLSPSLGHISLLS